jgi:hypothetical protein
VFEERRQLMDACAKYCEQTAPPQKNDAISVTPRQRNGDGSQEMPKRNVKAG